MGTYGNALQALIANPGSYQGSPGFKFALDSGSDAVQRAMSARGMNGSGNVLAELMKYGTGLAMQDYGSQVDRLGRLEGQNQQYDVAHEANANNRTSADQQFGLGLYRAGNDLSLGQGQNANNAQRNWWDYSLGREQNANTAANNQNNFNINQGRNAIDWFGANTQRGTAQSNAWLGDQGNQRAWYSIYPRQRYA